MKLKNKDKQYIVAINNKNEPCSLAEVIVKNNIDYKPKISVIIPIYNNELFLQDFLETVVNQTLKEIEIICIDNGSIDNSLDLLVKFSQEDRRITIIKQKNQNFGVALNTGLSIAKGEYLSFLDSNYLFELNMLEEMYKKVMVQHSDIVIYQFKPIDLENWNFEGKKINYNFGIDLVPNKETFSVIDIPNNIFQISHSWVWDKLFKTDFIKSNNIKFPNIITTYDIQFTYISLCLANKIAIIRKKLVIKRHQNKKLLFLMKRDDPSSVLLSFDKIKFILERKGLFKFVEKSFFKWIFSFCIFKLKTIDKKSKEYFYYFLQEKFRLWNYIDKSPPNSELYREIQYIKNQKVFPTINIAYAVSKNYFNLFLVSLISLLKNSEFENINIILVYHDITDSDIREIKKLKDIHDFSLQTLFIGKNIFNYYPNEKLKTKEEFYQYIFDDKFSDLEKILYLDSDTIIRKSLLPLWEINMDDKLFVTFENISLSKDKAKDVKLKDNLYINDGAVLINFKKWRKLNIHTKLIDFFKNKMINDSNQNSLNKSTDKQKLRLNPEYNFIENWLRVFNCQYEHNHSELYKKKDPTILHLAEIKYSMNKHNNSFIYEFLKYYNLSKYVKNSNSTIPIVLSSDEKYAPFMYTTIVSILENANLKTFYSFYLLVPDNFSKIAEHNILKINDNYKCCIHFIHIKNEFNNFIKKISNITLSKYYGLLIGDLLPKDLDKCIYLDIDVCACKDLAELFNLDIKDNYIAGVVSEEYYFLKEKNYKRLNISSMKKYVDVGMLVMNLKRIRADNMTQKFIELSKENYELQDQDILNIACFGKIKTLPPKFNVMITRIKEKNPYLRNLYTEHEILEARSNPYIIHYSDKKKPWNSIGIYMESYWWNIAKKIPYIYNLFKRDNIYKNELKKWWFTKKKKKLNIDNPKSFNEKIQWLKLYDSTPIKTYLTDKYLVRKWIKEKIGGEYLIPLIGTYDKFDDINFKNLPKSFVIKCNHGCGYNIIVKDKSLLNLNITKYKIDKWMNTNFAFENGLELQYKNIKPKIIIEKYMDDDTGDLRDYKFHCFNGIPKFLWIDSNRHTVHKRNLYDLKWNQLPYKINTLYSTFPSPKKPKLLNRMIKLSAFLSKGFVYARIDLYNIGEKIYFGEITFTSASGIAEITPKRFEEKLASFIKLPKIAFNIDTGKYYRLLKPFSLYPYYIISIIIVVKLIYNIKISMKFRITILDLKCLK